jgi:hypothetical protein
MYQQEDDITVRPHTIISKSEATNDLSKQSKNTTELALFHLDLEEFFCLMYRMGTSIRK